MLKRIFLSYFVSVLLLSAIFGTHLITPVSAYSQLGDANGDNQVDVWDLYLVAWSFCTSKGDPKYNPNADFDNNGVVYTLDLGIVGKKWYEGVPRTEGPPTVTPGYAKVSIHPSLIEGPGVGDNFTVYINIENVTDLYALSVGLSWDPTVLKCTKMTNNCSFLGPCHYLLGFAGTMNNSMGEIYPPCATSLRGDDTDRGVTGSGTLFQVEFTVVFEGSTWLNFTQLTLINSAGEPIPFDLVNSYFSLYQPKPHGPTAKFSYSPAAAFANERVSFDASSSLPGWDGTARMPIISYYWNFGDGATATGSTTTHTYTSEGTYTVTLNVTDSQGLWNITTKAITVSTQQTTMYVHPQHVLGNVGGTFKVYINIEGVKDLWCWSIDMCWNSSVLRCLSFTLNFSFFGPEDQLIYSYGTINNTAGKIEWSYAFFDYSKHGEGGVNGSGTLAQGVFRVLSNGSTPINIPLTYLADYDGYEIPCQVVNGYFGVPPPPHGPTAHFTYSPNDVFINVTTTFDASASLPGWKGIATIPIANYTWDFGDETPIVTETDPSTTHSYTAAGTYMVTLIVTGDDGLWSITSKWITVLQPYGPKTKFTYSPPEPAVNLDISFNASPSEPGCNGTTVPIVSYHWDFGDETNATETDPIITHNYEAEGTYTVTLTVTDEQARWDTTSQNITVLEPHGPTAVFTYSPPQPLANVTTFFNATLSRTGWNLTTQPIISYEWDFGDGTNVVTANQTFTHIYGSVGNYTITLIVTDAQGKWDVITQRIIVNLAEFSLVTLYQVHLDLNYLFTEGTNLKVVFYTYDGVYEGDTTVCTNENPTRTILSTDIMYPQGKLIEVVKLVLTDDSGNVLKTVTSFIMHRTHLFSKIAEIGGGWSLAPLEERRILWREIIKIAMQWPYVPP